jgi:hypothetical protein
MDKLISFEEALIASKKYTERHLILGNGFSIGCFPEIFNYSSLYNKIDFSHMPELKKVFDALKTHDFETIIQVLNNSVKVLPFYLPREPNIINSIVTHAEELKELLVQTIAENHPRIPSDIQEEKYIHCKKFLSHFLGEATNRGQVYTLNYDLLLYWVLMHESPLLGTPVYKIRIDDGFGNIEDDFETPYVIWGGNANTSGQRVHYLHGALHLFDAGHELKKYTWIRSGVSLVDQTRQSIQNNEFPLFVSEGTSQQKMNKIAHHAYLYHSYKSLVENFKQPGLCFFIYGHSLAENDEHILRNIAKGKFPMLYIGIYGSPNKPENKLIINQAEKLVSARQLKHDNHPLELCFYDSESASVWE